MIISNYLKMNYTELEQEIDKQKKKIESAKETIRLLEKLQVAEVANQNHKKSQPQKYENGGNHGSIR
jgi:hypothetical protein